MTTSIAILIPDYLTRAQVAQFFPISIRFLERVAANEIAGPPAIRPSEHRYVYRRIDIAAWLDSHLSCNSNQPPKRGRPTLSQQEHRLTRKRLLDEAKLRSGDGSLKSPVSAKSSKRSSR